MATSLLTQFTAPAIDGQAVKRVLAPEIMMNYVQAVIHQNGYGVTEKFSTDTDAFEIRVVRENPLTQNARSLGATLNGGYFNSGTYEQPTSTEYGIRLTFEIDNNIDIPANMQDMFPLDVVGATTRNLGQLVSKNVNASTLATQVASNLNYNAEVQDASGTPTWVEVTLGTTNLYEAFMSASVALDDGDVANGVDYFDVDQRMSLWRPTVRQYLLREGIIVLGGSNFGQVMIANGKVDPSTGKPRENLGGYFGDIDRTPQHIATSAIWTLAELYLGLTAGGLDDVYGMSCASIGTGRALAFNSTIKVIDSPVGQGMRIQPKYRWGLETWFPKSVVLFVATGFANPAYPGSVVTPLTVVAPGSRS